MTFLLERSNFIIGNKYCQLFLLKWQTCFIRFWGHNLPDSQVQITSFFVSHPLKWKGCSIKVSSSLRSNSGSHTSTFLHDNHHISTCKSPVCIITILSHGILKRCLFQGWDLVKLIVFTASSRTLSKIGVLFCLFVF